MPKTKISEFSATPANNTDIDSINIAEGCAPSGINDAIRELMAQLKDFQTGAVGDSFNGPVGTTTAAAGAFTTLSASSTLSVTGAGSIQGLTVGRGAGAVATNTAVGASALAANTTGKDGVAIGNLALRDNTTGIANLAIGSLAMITNTTGGYNTAIGNGEAGVSQGALGLNTTGSNNTGVGYQALRSNTTASNNTAVGYQAGYSNVTGVSNVFVGESAGRSSTANSNTFIGQDAGYNVTSGANNTILGGYNGNQGSLDIRTSSNNVVLSDGDGNIREYIDSSGGVFWAMGQAIYTNGVSLTSDASFVFLQTFSSKPLKINNQGNVIYAKSIYDSTGSTGANVFVNADGLLQRSTSSLKYKKNIQDASYGLADVLKLRAVTYQAKDSVTKDDKGQDVTSPASPQVLGGLIAEEVHEVGLTQFVQYAEDGSPDALSYGNMVSLLTKAIQEQQAIIESLKARLDAANL